MRTLWSGPCTGRKQSHAHAICCACDTVSHCRFIGEKHTAGFLGHSRSVSAISTMGALACLGCPYFMLLQKSQTSTENGRLSSTIRHLWCHTVPRCARRLAIALLPVSCSRSSENCLQCLLPHAMVERLCILAVFQCCNLVHFNKV
jgi:hypothetical protein